MSVDFQPHLFVQSSMTLMLNNQSISYFFIW